MENAAINTQQPSGIDSIKENLEQVSRTIDSMLQEDPFPANIEPDYLRQAVTAYPTRGGKRLRPAIVLWSCGLFDGDPEKARHAALAVELYHNWTLIHDDIIDQDSLRRGSATCHVLVSEQAHEIFPRMAESEADQFGKDMAILAGDILHSWAARTLQRTSTEDIEYWRVQALLERMTGWLTPRLISGEAMDVELGQRENVDREHVEYAMQLKTGALLAYAAEAGGLLSPHTTGLEDPRVQTLSRFGRTIGLAFQLQDDYLGLYGSDKNMGKDIGSDLREGRIPYPVACTLETAPAADQSALRSILQKKELSAEDIDQAYGLIEKNGGDRMTSDRTEELFREGEKLLESFSEGQYRRCFEELLAFLRHRQS